VTNIKPDAFKIETTNLSRCAEAHFGGGFSALPYFVAGYMSCLSRSQCEA